jgi:hypothetical protein
MTEEDKKRWAASLLKSVIGLLKLGVKPNAIELDREDFLRMAWACGVDDPKAPWRPVSAPPPTVSLESVTGPPRPPNHAVRVGAGFLVHGVLIAEAP